MTVKNSARMQKALIRKWGAQLKFEMYIEAYVPAARCLGACPEDLKKQKEKAIQWLRECTLEYISKIECYNNGIVRVYNNV